MAAIGMSVPGATDLGLGAQLGQQLGDETEEARRKRLLAAQQQRLLPGTSAAVGASSLLTGGFGAAIS